MVTVCGKKTVVCSKYFHIETKINKLVATKTLW